MKTYKAEYLKRGGAVIKGMAAALRHVIKELDAEACEDIDYAQVSGALSAYELFGSSINPPGEGVADESGCTCQICGTNYSHDLITPDDIWELIKPDGKAEGAGLLCPMCIVDRLGGLGWSAIHVAPNEQQRDWAVADKRAAFEVVWPAIRESLPKHHHSEYEYYSPSDVENAEEEGAYHGWLYACLNQQDKPVSVELLKRAVPLLRRIAYYNFGVPVTPDAKVAKELLDDIKALLAQQGKAVGDE